MGRNPRFIRCTAPGPSSHSLARSKTRSGCLTRPPGIPPVARTNWRRVSDRYRPRREVRLRERNVFPVKGLLLLSRKDFRSRKRVEVYRLYGPGNRRSCRRTLAAIVKLHPPLQDRRYGILSVATRSEQFS